MTDVRHGAVRSISDPKLSLFQSAVAQVATTPSQKEGLEAVSSEVSMEASFDNDMIEAATSFAEAIENTVKISNVSTQEPAIVAEVVATPAANNEEGTFERVGVGQVLGSLAGCAKLAFQMGEATLRGDLAAATRLKDTLAFNTCDPR